MHTPARGCPISVLKYMHIRVYICHASREAGIHIYTRMMCMFTRLYTVLPSVLFACFAAADGANYL